MPVGLPPSAIVLCKTFSRWYILALQYSTVTKVF